MACAAFDLLMSCNAVNEPRSRLDASLRLGVLISWEMKLSSRPWAGLIVMLFLGIFFSQRSWVASKWFWKRARHLPNFWILSFLLNFISQLFYKKLIFWYLPWFLFLGRRMCWPRSRQGCCTALCRSSKSSREQKRPSKTRGGGTAAWTVLNQRASDEFSLFFNCL